MRFPLILSLCALHLAPIAATALSSDESLVIRRITEYWKDEDYKATKDQILSFLTKHPDTSVFDHLHMMLGDIYYMEKSFANAAVAYGKIREQELKQKSITNHLHSLFKLGKFDDVILLGDNKDSLNYQSKLILAESLFRQMQSMDEGEEKNDVARKTEALYVSLQNEGFEDDAIYPLAQTYRVLGKTRKSASQFTKLADKYPDKAEQFLLQAASLQVEFAPSESASTLKIVAALNGEKMGYAAERRMQLLFQTADYETLIGEIDLIKAQLPKEKCSDLNYFVGHAYLKQGNKEKCVEYLTQFTHEEKSNSQKVRSSFLTMLSIAQENHDDSQFDQTLSLFTERFPEDHELPNALFIHANFAIERGDLQSAQDDLQLILHKFPDHENREALVYDYALLLFQNSNYGKSREVFLTYADQFPNGEKNGLAWSHILNCSLKMVASSTEEQVGQNKEKLVKDLQSIFDKENILTPEESEKHRFLLAKTLYETKRYSEALSAFETFLSLYPENKNVPEAHLLLGISAIEGKAAHSLFIEHAEKALSANPQYQKEAKIYTQLFNSYLASAKECDGEEQISLLDKGAENLYKSFEILSSGIKKENASWLANHYFAKAKNEYAQESTSGSIDEIEKKLDKLYATLIQIDGETGEVVIQPNEVYLEVDTLNYATLLGYQHDIQKKIAVLEALKCTQEKKPEYTWEIKPLIAFTLAKTYAQHGMPEKAINAYEQLIEATSHTPSFHTYLAQLEKGRLKFSLINLGDLSEQSEEVTLILDCFKDLQIKKNLLSEPLHIEAALDYCDIRIALAAKQYQNERALFFLNRIVEDYESQGDIIAKEYFNARANHPELNLLYENYMKYISAEILRREAIQIRGEGKIEAAEAKEGEASLIFNTLIIETKGTTDYLKNKCRCSLELMN